MPHSKCLIKEILATGNMHLTCIHISNKKVIKMTVTNIRIPIRPLTCNLVLKIEQNDRMEGHCFISKDGEKTPLEQKLQFTVSGE